MIIKAINQDEFREFSFFNPEWKTREYKIDESNTNTEEGNNNINNNLNSNDKNILNIVNTNNISTSSLCSSSNRPSSPISSSAISNKLNTSNNFSTDVPPSPTSVPNLNLIQNEKKFLNSDI
jgi:hypothetical protein